MPVRSSHTGHLSQLHARCIAVFLQMYEQWKSLLPSTVAEAVAVKPYTVTVATVLLHDPDPRTRRTASSTLHAMLDGSKRYLASAELASVASILGRLPTVEEYMEYAAKINTMASDVYRYLSFDQIAEFRESAANANIPVLQA